MTDPVQELADLSRSKHRIHLLRALREPCDRETLRDRSGASKPTLSRELAKFESRSWVTRVDGNYRLTALGEVVADGLDAAIRSFETVEKLGPLAAWLPVDQFGFDLDRFHDATVLLPSPHESLGIHRRLASRLYEANSVRTLTGTVALNGIDLHRRAIEDHDQTLEVVLTVDALQTVRTNEEMAHLGAIVHESDGVSIFRYDGTLSYFLALADDCVLVGLFDEAGGIRGLIESDDSTVLKWAEETLDSYRRDAVEVDTILP